MAPEIADGVTLKTVVVDDEQLAREELCYLLGQMGGVEIVAQAADGLQAIDAIESLDPDLVLLDVQMPGLTGFEVARRLLESGSESHVVFVTAFDRHAVEAFDVNAVDYLLKPVEAERLGRPSTASGGGSRVGAGPRPFLRRPSSKNCFSCSPDAARTGNSWR